VSHLTKNWNVSNTG